MSVFVPRLPFLSFAVQSFFPFIILYLSGVMGRFISTLPSSPPLFFFSIRHSMGMALSIDGVISPLFPTAGLLNDTHGSGFR
jgi:hypothetical protein